MQTILLLHGALGTEKQLQPLAELLSKDYHVHTLSFSGHGGRAFDNGPFSIPLFAADVLAYMNQHGIATTSIFGYSMGGYVGMYLAKHHPDKVSKVITLATKYYWDATTAAKEVQMLDAEKIVAKIPAFAKTLEERHASNNWKQVLAYTAEMMLQLGNDNPLKTADYSSVQHPSLIMLGDRDKMVTLEETMAVYKSLPNAQLAILPNTPHPIEQVDVELLAYFIKRFV